MKENILKFTHTSIKIISLFMVFSCGEDKGNDNLKNKNFEDQEIIETYVDHVILPTYSALYQQSKLLEDAIKILNNNPNEENYIRAKQAWITTRQPWEQSEGFLFGPVDTFGFDPALDSWPVDLSQLENNITVDSHSNGFDLTSRDGNVRGFHTIEYLLFGLNSEKKLAEINSNELKYLLSLSSDLKTNAQGLYDSWTKNHDNTGKSYRDIFATAGQAHNNYYPSQSNAIQQILDSIIGIADEVATGKIAGPFQEQKLSLVESRFSFNSLQDFTDNIISLKISWQGHREEENKTGRSLQDYVQEKNPKLAKQVDEKIALSIQSIKTIKQPFYKSAVDPSQKDNIQNSINSILELRNILEKEIRPLVLGN